MKLDALLFVLAAVLIQESKSLETPLVNPTALTFITPEIASPKCFALVSEKFTKECKANSEAHWPKAASNANATTFEVCCSQYELLNCLKAQATALCLPAPDPMVAYATALESYLLDSVCSSYPTDHFETTCSQKSQAERIAKFQKEPATAHTSLRFFAIPGDNPAKIVLEMVTGKLKVVPIIYALHHTAKAPYVEACYAATEARWDSAHSKYLESTLLGSCCAVYETLDCVLDHAKQDTAHQFLKEADLPKLEDYRKTTVAILDATVCKPIGHEHKAQLCHP